MVLDRDADDAVDESDLRAALRDGPGAASSKSDSTVSDLRFGIVVRRLVQAVKICIARGEVGGEARVAGENKRRPHRRLNPIGRS